MNSYKRLLLTGCVVIVLIGTATAVMAFTPETTHEHEHEHNTVITGGDACSCSDITETSAKDTSDTPGGALSSDNETTDSATENNTEPIKLSNENRTGNVSVETDLNGTLGDVNINYGGSLELGWNATRSMTVDRDGMTFNQNQSTTTPQEFDKSTLTATIQNNASRPLRINTSMEFQTVDGKTITTVTEPIITHPGEPTTVRYHFDATTETISVTTLQN